MIKPFFLTKASNSTLGDLQNFSKHMNHTTHGSLSDTQGEMAPARTMPTVQATFHWVILCNTTHLLLTERVHKKTVYTVILILNSALLNPPRDLTQQDGTDFHGLFISNSFPLFGLLTHWVTTKNWLLQKYFKTLQLQIHSPIYMYRPFFYIHLTKLTHEAPCNNENYHYFFYFSLNLVCCSITQK